MSQNFMVLKDDTISVFKRNSYYVNVNQTVMKNYYDILLTQIIDCYLNSSKTEIIGQKIVETINQGII